MIVLQKFLNTDGVLLPIEKLKMEILSLKEVLVCVEELFNVVELVGVESSPSACFARYRRKINLLEYCRF